MKVLCLKPLLGHVCICISLARNENHSPSLANNSAFLLAERVRKVPQACLTEVVRSSAATDHMQGCSCMNRRIFPNCGGRITLKWLFSPTLRLFSSRSLTSLHLTVGKMKAGSGCEPSHIMMWVCVSLLIFITH